MQTFVALLRAVNASGHNRLLMADLRHACAALGWRNVKSYIQSGNLVFQSDKTAVALENELELALADQFQLSVPVVVRTAGQWAAYCASNPYPQASQDRPNLIMLALSKRSLPPEAIHELQARAAANERIAQAGDALWIDYADGSARSKLSPTLLDRLIGSPVTTRNWRTVIKLNELVQG